MNVLARFYQPSKLGLRPIRTSGSRFFSSESDRAPFISGNWLKDGIYSHFTDNAFVSTVSADTVNVYNPATQEVTGRISEISSSEFNDIVRKSQEAYEEWRLVPLSIRQRFMLRYQQLIRDRSDDLAELITIENGKTLSDSRGDVFRGLEVVESACFVAPHMQGNALAGVAKTVDTTSYREPLGKLLLTHCYHCCY